MHHINLCCLCYLWLFMLFMLFVVFMVVCGVYAAELRLCVYGFSWNALSKSASNRER